MAVKPCKECGKPVSTKAKSCPHCGAEQPKQTSRIALGIAGLFLFFIIYSVATTNSNTTPTSTQASKPKTPEEIEKEREFQQVVASVKALKNAMKNPKSFELVDAIMVKGPTLCITYRSTNSFNAVVTERHVLSDKLSSSETGIWNKHCAGKEGNSYAFIKSTI